MIQMYDYSIYVSNFIAYYTSLPPKNQADSETYQSANNEHMEYAKAKKNVEENICM